MRSYRASLDAALKTSQSRVGKMEHGDRTVTIDLLLQALFQMGLKRKNVAALVGSCLAAEVNRLLERGPLL
jgi:hypothetical protein